MTQTLQQVDQDGNVLQSYKVLNPLPFSDGNGFDYCYENGAQGWAWDEDGKKWTVEALRKKPEQHRANNAGN